MGNQICPICATGTCQYRDGITCKMWVCASGLYKGKGAADGFTPNGGAASGVKANMDGFNTIMETLMRATGRRG